MFYILKLPLTISLLLGVMAATAPAATLAVVREYRAKGNLTTTLLGVVALDDAVAIIFFGIVSAVVALLLQGGGIGLGIVVFSLAEVVKSSLLGALTGIVLTFLFPYLLNRRHKVAVLIGVVLLNSGAAYALDLSPLMVNMVCGFLVANLYQKPEELNFLEDIEMPVILIFFTLAGAGLQLEVLLKTGSGLSFTSSRAGWEK